MPNEFNDRIIREFRENAGKVGPPFQGAPMALLTTIGKKTGNAHTTPLVYLPDGGRVIVFGSKGGAPTHPDWYRNLHANPDVTVEVGTDRYKARAVEVTGAERDAIYARQVAAFPAFGDYQHKTTRKIPVIVLERVAD